MLKNLTKILIALSLIFIFVIFLFVSLFQYSRVLTLKNEIASLITKVEQISKQNKNFVAKDTYWYQVEEERSQKYFTYYKDWETFKYYQTEGDYRFIGCLQFQYPKDYILNVSKDGRYFDVSDKHGNSVIFIWDYMGDFCANIGCYTYDAIKLPENVTQNYSTVKLLGNLSVKTIDRDTPYFAEIELKNTGYRVNLESYEKNNFSQQLNILSTLSLGRYSCGIPD